MPSKSTSTSRTPFASNTPDRTTFERDHPVSLSPQVSYIPVPATARPQSTYTQARWWLTHFTRRPREVVERNTGLLLVASSQLFFSLMNVGVKKLNSLDPPVPAVELIFVRMAITWICCVVFMYLLKVPDPFSGPKGVRFFLVQRGMFGFVGLFGLYYSLQYLSLSDGTVLQFLSPMFTAIAGAVFLHETFSMREALAGLTSLAGVVLIARPKFLFGSTLSHETAITARAIETLSDSDVISTKRVTAVGVALLGAVGAAGAYTTIRHIGKRAHPLHNLVAYSALCVVVTTVVMIAMRTPVVVPTRWDWLLTLLLIGIFGFTGQFLLTLGLQRETAGRGTIAVYGQIVFATILERIVFHTAPSPLSIVGTVIIIGSALYVALTKDASATKRQQDARTMSSDDRSVEEGLLSNHVEDDSEVDEALTPEDNGVSIRLSTDLLAKTSSK